MNSEGFTHIVVGAGSAGCVLTARIAENPSFTVLLVEAGPDSVSTHQKGLLGLADSRKVPMRGQSETYNEEIDWDLVVDMPGAQSMRVPQAKLMGGGSSINGGTALRNTEADADAWVSLGNDAWDFESLYDTYQDMEDDPVRGTHGPHPIARTPLEEAGKIQRSFLEGAVSSGFKRALDFNATGAEGVGPSPVCRRGDRRISAANTFIDPIRGQKNLTIITEAQVDTVCFSKDRATGVTLVDGRRFYSTKEVIVSAGAIFSPAILQRSGIGPSSLLSSLEVPVIADLPVGSNLSDHPCIPIVAKSRDGAYSSNDYSLQMQARWSSFDHPRSTDLQLICFSYLYAQTQNSALHQRSLSGTAEGHVAGIGCNLNKPTSKGAVNIRSKDAKAAPLVAPNYLKTNADREAARNLVRTAYQIITSPPMQEVLHQPIGLTDAMLSSDQLLDEWIQSQYSSTYHFCCSCRMASREHDGVVDQSGRVYGVEGLRVCDASVIPTVPAANTMWTTMLFAQRIGCGIRDNVNVSKNR